MRCSQCSISLPMTQVPQEADDEAEPLASTLSWGGKLGFSDDTAEGRGPGQGPAVGRAYQGAGFGAPTWQGLSMAYRSGHHPAMKVSPMQRPYSTLTLTKVGEKATPVTWSMCVGNSDGHVV